MKEAASNVLTDASGVAAKLDELRAEIKQVSARRRAILGHLNTEGTDGSGDVAANALRDELVALSENLSALVAAKNVLQREVVATLQGSGSKRRKSKPEREREYQLFFV